MSKDKVKLKIVILTIIWFSFLGIFQPSYAYSPNNTHPDLTKEMAELYNFLEKGHKFSQKQVDWMKKGAENEDKPARWINHFYDPVHKIGWDGSNFGNLSKEEGLAQGESLAPKKLLPSIEWVVNQEYQSAYGNQYGNRTWQRALHSYIDGDEKEAFVTLGHILHLVEDLSVPDHTRNDPHSGMFGDSSSPYEDYSKEYSNSNTLLVAEKLFLDKARLMDFDNVQDAFEYMANYSNENFFSADTINNIDYSKPNIFSLDKVIKKINNKNVVFLYNSAEDIYLSRIIKEAGSVGMFLKDEAFVLPSYVEHLFPKAVLVGASVIDLFFKEVEKYKADPESLEPLVSDSREVVVQTIKKSPKIIVLNIANFVDNTVVGTKIVIQSTKDKIVKSVSSIASVIASFFSVPSSANDIEINNVASVVKAVDSTQEPVKVVVLEEQVVVETKLKIEASSVNVPTEEVEEVIVEDEKIEEPIVIETSTEDIVVTEEFPTYQPNLIPINTPFYGGGGGGVKTQPAIEEDPPTPDPSPPDAPVITSPTATTFATTTVTFTGTATSTLIISTDYTSATTTADINNQWSLTLSDFSEGTITVSFYSTEDTLTSSAVEYQLTIDTTAPAIPSLTITECSNSLSSSVCLSPSTTANLSFTSTSTDISYYEIVKDSTVVSTTTATTSAQTLSNGTSSIEIVAYDSAGNSSTSTSQSIIVDTRPIVINEIAWSGTASSTADEWIELYNTTSYTIDLSNVTLSATDGVPYLPLSGTIATDSYYLIERTDDTTTSVTADLTTPFSGIGGGSGLSNTVEVISLIHNYGSTTIDSTPSVSAWSAGQETNNISMERINSDNTGTDENNWASNNTYTKNGTDVGGNTINGTPKSRNSVSLHSIGYYCPDETTSFVSGGYYIPTSGSCVYLSSSISGNRYGDIYKGTVASSTIINGHSLGSNATSTQNNDNLSNPIQGEDYFVAIYARTTINVDDITNFRNYFKTGANAPPHLDYGVLEWKYGVAP